MTHKMYTLFLSLLISLSFTLQAQHLVRYPDLSPDGTQLAFCYQGDIWTSSIDGGDVKRWTVHEAYDSHPRWSRDGRKICFQSNRFGNDDIYMLDLATASITQMTYYSSPDRSAAWTIDNRLTFITDREYQQVEREDEVWQFEEGLATPNRALDALALAVEPSFDANIWGLVKGYCRTTREEYTGPAERDIWLYIADQQIYQKIGFPGAQDIQVRFSEEEVFILSAKNGTYNIYHSPFPSDSWKWEQLTDVTKPGIRYFDVSRNGKVLVYERGDQIIVQQNGLTQKVKWQLPTDFTFYPSKQKTYTSSVSDFSLSPNEKYISLHIRGELFLTQNDDKKDRTVRLTKHPFRDQNPSWLNDSTMLFLSDRKGKEQVYKLTSQDGEISDLFWTFAHDIRPMIERDEMITGLSLSPKKDQIALLSEPGRLEIAPIDSQGRIGEWLTLLDGWAMPRNLSWSPDGKWLAYAQSDLTFNTEVYILPTDGTQDPVNVSMHPRSDFNPVWSPDGSKLAFISNRNNGDNDIWFVWLTEEDYLKSQSDWDEWEDYPKAFKKRLGLTEDSAAVELTQVDVDHIHRRMVQVTKYSGNESNIAFDKSGETLYFVRSNGKDRELMSICWNGKEEKVLFSAKGLNGLQLGPNQTHLYYLQNGKVKSVKTGDKKPKNVAFRASMKIEFEEEKEQIFEEAWRQLNANFYDPNFHGKDFSALKSQYKPLALQASTKRDFRDMFNEMLGQLNASHMGLYGGNREEVEKIKSGKLGLSLIASSEGWKVERVIPKGPADRPESRLFPGDIIVKIQGDPIDASINAYQLLEGMADKRIWLGVTNEAGEERDVYLRCASSLSNLLYEEWVEKRRQLTDTYSQGQLGYIHIQGMNWSSFERFERELMASGYNKKGIVIDVRYNGGGWTTDMLMTVLNVRQHAYTIPRGATDDLSTHRDFQEYYPYGERLPLSAWTKPSVALCNHTSYSNAEIFSHAFKNLDIGPLVGEPTFGAVISTGGARLMDGSFVRLPFRGWFVKKDGANMDFQPAVPDHILIPPPDEKAAMQDRQLEKAVQVLLTDMQ